MRANRSALLRMLASVAGASLFAMGCVGDQPPPVDQPPTDDPPVPPDNGDTSGGQDTTFDHPDPQDPWDLLDRILVEGHRLTAPTCTRA